MKFWTQIRRESLVGVTVSLVALAWMYWYLCQPRATPVPHYLLAVFSGAGLVAATTVLRCGYSLIMGRPGEYPFGPLR